MLKEGRSNAPCTRVVVATAADKSYLLPVKVMISSLVQHLDISCKAEVHVVQRNLSDADLRELNAFADTRSLVPGTDLLDKIPHQRGFVPESAFPLLLADLLPDVDRVLFLDPDVLVLDDVAELWNTDLKGKTIAAVTDQAIGVCGSSRGVKNCRAREIPDDAAYFNAGVMLIDLARWRELDVSRRVGIYIEDQKGATDFFHQEGLNAILWNDWIQLDARWNLIASLTDRRYSSPLRVDIDNPGIVHFAGRIKPWRVDIGGPYASRYDEFVMRCAPDGESASRSLSAKMLGFYDRRLRDYIYPAERALWNKRLI
jgi:lipopolysaccharide biosynthesis glycosyltransferase